MGHWKTSVCGSKTPPCVHSERFRVYRRNVHVSKTCVRSRERGINSASLPLSVTQRTGEVFFGCITRRRKQCRAWHTRKEQHVLLTSIVERLQMFLPSPWTTISLVVGRVIFCQRHKKQIHPVKKKKSTLNRSTFRRRVHSNSRQATVRSHASARFALQKCEQLCFGTV